MQEDTHNIISDGEIELELCLSLPSKESYYYHIKKDNVHIGNCGLRLEETIENYLYGNLEYEIFEEYRGNGYAEKASRLLGKIASDLGVRRIGITANPDNLASIKTIEKLGARFLKVIEVPDIFELSKDSPYISMYEWRMEKGEKLK